MKNRGLSVSKHWREVKKIWRISLNCFSPRSGSSSDTKPERHQQPLRSAGWFKRSHDGSWAADGSKCSLVALTGVQMVPKWGLLVDLQENAPDLRTVLLGKRLLWNKNKLINATLESVYSSASMLLVGTISHQEIISYLLVSCDSYLVYNSALECIHPALIWSHTGSSLPWHQHRAGQGEQREPCPCLRAQLAPADLLSPAGKGAPTSGCRTLPWMTVLADGTGENTGWAF